VLVVVYDKENLEKLACRISRIEEVILVDLVLGFVDLVVEIETQGIAQISTVVEAIRRVNGVGMTFSLPAVYPVRKEKELDKLLQH